MPSTTPMHNTDYEQDGCLVRRARKRDAEAMRQIVVRHQDHVYRLAYRLTGDVEAAQDATQDTFLKAFQSLDDVKNERALTRWLRQILLNLVRDRWRTRKETIPFDEETFRAPGGDTDPLHQTQMSEIGAQVQAALLQLPEGHREAFVLKHVEELDYESISLSLDISVSAAKVRVHRACRMLRDLLPEFAPT